MKHYKFSKNIFTIFNVEVISKFINLYISLLAVVAIFITIGWFNIQNHPKIELLTPVYAFDMTRINSVLLKHQNTNIFPVIASLNNKYCLFNDPDSMNLKNSIKYRLPYYRVGAKKFQRSHSLNKDNYFYHTGISDQSDITRILFNTSVKRTDNQKRLGLSELLVWDSLEKFSKDSLSPGGTIKLNPLGELKKNLKILSNKVFDEIGRELIFATTIYNYISVGNYSNENIESIDLFINDVLNTGMLQVIGWTEGSCTTTLKSDGPNLRLSLKELQKNQSVEILIRGNKKLRDNDIKISSPFVSSLSNKKLVCTLTILFILVLILFILDKLRRKLINDE